MPSEQWRYGVQNLAAHLAGNADLARLERLLGALEFLEIKLSALGVPALLADYEFLPGDSALRDVQAAIRLGTQALERDPAQLPAQLLGRLSKRDTHTVLAQLLAAAAGAGQLVPLTRSLSSGRGGLLQSRHLVRGAHALVLTSDDKQVICGSKNLVWIWDLTGNRADRWMAGHRDRVEAIALTPGDRWLISADNKGTICVWHFETGQMQLRWQGHQGRVNCLICAPDGRRFLSAGEEGLVKEWELTGGKEVQRFAGHTAAVKELALTADGQTVVSSSSDRTLRIWDLSGGHPPQLFGPDEAWSSPIALTVQGYLIATRDRQVVVMELSTGRVVRELPVGHVVDSLSVSTDGRRMVVVAAEGLQIWDLESGAKRVTPQQGLSLRKAVLSRDGTRIFAVGSGLMIVRDLAAEPEVESDRARVASLAITPDGRFAVFGSSTGTLSVWSLPEGKEVRRISGSTSSINALVVTPDGKQIITGDHKGKLGRWDLTSGEILPAPRGYETDNAVMAVDLIDEGRFLVSGSGWGDVTVWELETGRCVCEHRLSPHYLTALVAIPGTRRVIVGVHHEDDQSPLVLDLEDGRCLHQLRGHIDGAVSIAVTSDGRTAVTGSEDRSLRVWDLATGTSIRTLTGHRGRPESVAVTPAGRHVVSCADDRTVKVWDIQMGRCVATFTSDRPLRRVAVAPDGRTIVACGPAGDLHVLRWTGQPADGSPEPA
jgi:WD40 repeat protein